MGPFVDSANPILDSLDETFDELFERAVNQFAAKCYEDSSLAEMRIVLVPSLHDVQHDFVFPQPAFDAAKLDKRIFLCSNPATLNINGIMIGFSSHDIVQQLASIAYSKKFVIVLNN